MGRKWHFVALTVAALSLGGAQDPQSNASSEQNQTAQIQQGSAKIADAILQASAKKDVGCPDGKEQRSSDLCAREELQSAIAGDKNLYVFGTVWYEDAFGEPRYTNFCFEAADLPTPGPGRRITDLEEGKYTYPPFHNDSN